jgi:hypothetical protein
MRLAALVFTWGVAAFGALSLISIDSRATAERGSHADLEFRDAERMPVRLRDGREGRGDHRDAPTPPTARQAYFLWMAAPSLMAKADARADQAEVAWRERNAALIDANVAGEGPVIDAPRRAAFVMANHQTQADLAEWHGHRIRLERAVSRRLGRPVRFGLQAAVAGSVVTTGLPPAEASRLEGLSGLRAVTPVRTYTLTDEAAARLVQSPSQSTGATIWEGRGLGFPAQGEGMVVAVLDTGIRPAHNAFATAHSDGYVQPVPVRGQLGLCADDAALGCSDKVIGIYDYTGRGLSSDGSLPPIPSATKGIDNDGHGTRMATNAIGSRVTGTSNQGVTAFSGVAPRAAVASYQVCVPGLQCRDDWIVAALDQAIRDGADVVNMSFGGGDTPLTGLPAIPFFDARDAGIVVVSGSGNTGPAPGVGNPCTAITVLCVGNSTTDRATVNGFPLGGFDAAQADILRDSSSRGPGTASLGLVKPDVVAPGTHLFTADYTSSNNYIFSSFGGTSTATALTSGAAALLRQLRPSWNAAATSSALSTSARPSIRLENGLAATPFEAGAGRIQVENAARQGLYFPDIVGPVGDLLPFRPICVDGTRLYAPDPRTYFCSQGGPLFPIEYWVDDNGDWVNDIEGGMRRVNRASVSHEACSGNCTVQRLVQGLPGTGRITWRARVDAPDGIEVSVSPNQFTLTPASQQLLTVRVRGYRNESGGFDPGWAFGRIWLEPVSVQGPDGRPSDGSRVTPAQVPWAVNFTDRENVPGQRPVSLPLNVLTTLTVPAGGAHERLWFDVPAGLGDTTLSIAVSGPGNVDLYVADAPTGETGTAPARSAAAYRAIGAGGAKEILVPLKRLKFGRLWITPVNNSGANAIVNVIVQPVRNAGL